MRRPVLSKHAAIKFDLEASAATAEEETLDAIEASLDDESIETQLMADFWSDTDALQRQITAVGVENYLDTVDYDELSGYEKVLHDSLFFAV